MFGIQEYHTWLLFIMCILVFSEIVSTCYTRCQWSPWGSYSECSRTCGGGYRSRSRPLCCPSYFSNYDDCLVGCNRQDDPIQSHEYESCGNVCYNGDLTPSWMYGITQVYRCYCHDGYTGTCCNINFNECWSDPCQHGGSCNDAVSEYTCSCLSGYTGANCETDINECSSSPCHHDGICHDHVNSYTCECLSGYTGTHCETDINECSSTPCQHAGICHDHVNSYTCECLPGYTGTHCETDIDECSSTICHHGGTCHDDINNYTCECLPGYTGVNCETDINECVSFPCQHEGTCIDAVNMYTCSCRPGYTGTNCQTQINECDSNPCLHGSFCTDQINGFYCTCIPGYTGGQCENDIDECASEPCQHQGTCIDRVFSYSCMCQAGYTGQNCETDINECSSTPCHHDGICHDHVNSYTCTCLLGYTGTHCETDINECSSDPCNHDGTCNDAVNAYTCTCVPGYTGTRCETDINECSSTPCHHDGICHDHVNSYTCACLPGYTGTHCETEIDECNSDPCQHGGTCADFIDRFECTCVVGYTGVMCETDIDECMSDPCLNGGTCIDGVNGYECSCTVDFYGVHCETGLCQPSPADVIFVLDSSVSQTKAQFKQQLEFVKAFVTNVTIGSNAFRISVITYSTASNVEFFLNAYSTSSDVELAVSNITFKPGVTYTNKGLQSVIDVISDENGGNTERPNGKTAKRYVILLTDGMSNKRTATREAAIYVRLYVHRIIAIGIGPQVSHKELLDIASPGDESTPSYVFYVENFNSLYTIIKQLVYFKCQKYEKSKLSDVIFLLDSSFYMTDEAFQAAIDGVTYVLSNVADYGMENGPRIGISYFDSELKTVSYLGHDISKESLVANLQSLSMNGICNDRKCGLNISDAIIKAAAESFAEEKGARPKARRFIIVVTNGKFSDEVNATDLHDALQSNNVRLFVIGVGEYMTTDTNGLFSLVRDSNHVFLLGTDPTSLDVLQSEFVYHVSD